MWTDDSPHKVQRPKKEGAPLFTTHSFSKNLFNARVMKQLRTSGQPAPQQQVWGRQRAQGLIPRQRYVHCAPANSPLRCVV